MPNLPHELLRLVIARRHHITSVGEQASRVAALAWSQLDPGNPMGSWDAALGPTMQRVMTAAQIASASGAQDYVTEALRIQGIDTAEYAMVPASAFIGAADGRDMASLLRLPAVSVKMAIDRGMSSEAATQTGLGQLRRIVVSETTDAGRVANGVATVAAKKATGYARMMVGNSCSRCIVLAGKRYRWNKGFRRHPQCDCVNIPAGDDSPDDLRTDPHRLFESMTAEVQDSVFTKGGAQAIRDGADLFQVVNARADMRSVTIAGEQLSTSAVGLSRLATSVRLTPESIYKVAEGNRSEALRLLRVHGYVL